MNKVIYMLVGNDYSWKYTFLAVIVTIIIVSATIVSIKNVLKERKDKEETFDPTKLTEYDKKVMSILDKYNDCIVEINTYKDFASKEIEKVYSFDDLLEERGSLKIPIMYYNIIDHLKCNFYRLRLDF